MARVPRAEVERQLGRIEELIKKDSSGLGRQQISEAYATEYGSTLASRTLQRRLEQLVIQDKVVVVGDGPRTSYRGRFGFRV